MEKKTNTEIPNFKRGFVKYAATNVVRGAIDKFVEFSSHEFISLSNHMKTCIQVKQLIATFIIKNVNKYSILKKNKWYP